MFRPYLDRWNLIPDGEAITTPTGCLLPVRQKGQPAMLKLATVEEERSGAALMEWWEGDGAAPVLARDDNALLLERARSVGGLADMARGGRDDEACLILCTVAARLHAPRSKPLPKLIPLKQWFRELDEAAATHGGILVRCAATASQLLADPRDLCVLHGDLHHGNALDFGPRGWLAIDPKGLIGERGFDFANIFCNPDLDDPTRPVATDPARFVRRLEIVTASARLERLRLLHWILAWAGLSAAWFLGDDQSADIDLTIAALAAAEIDRF